MKQVIVIDDDDDEPSKNLEELKGKKETCVEELEGKKENCQEEQRGKRKDYEIVEIENSEGKKELFHVRKTKMLKFECILSFFFFLLLLFTLKRSKKKKRSKLQI